MASSSSKPYEIASNFEILPGEVSTSGKEDKDGVQMRYEAWQAVLIIVVCSGIVIATLLGNVLVCLSVSLVRKLRTPSNWLIVSLALADLLVALAVMPLAMVYEIVGIWKFGKVLCDVWTSSDVLLCTASILNLCAISIDRYLTITRPFVYAAKRTPCRMALMIISVWVLSALISIPPLFGWRAAPPPNHCELSQDVAYQFYATVGAFYLPLFVMIVVYYRIFVVSDRVRKTEAKLQPLNSSPSPGNYGYASPFSRSRAPSRQASQQCLYFPDNSSQRHLSTSNLANNSTIKESDKTTKTLTFGTTNRLEVYDPRLGKLTPSVSHRRLSQQPESKSASDLETANEDTAVDGKHPQRHSFDLSGVSFFSRRASATPSQHSRCGRTGADKQSKLFSFGRSSSSSTSSREHRTTKTLGIIMGSFIICWLPFFILALIRPLLHDPSVIPHWLGSGLLWLGFANSLLNPVIYARFNREFRTPFKHILMCRCKDLDAKLRMEIYTEKYGVCQASFDGGSRIQLNALNANYGKTSRRESSIGSMDFIKITRDEVTAKRSSQDGNSGNIAEHVQREQLVSEAPSNQDSMETKFIVPD